MLQAGLVKTYRAIGGLHQGIVLALLALVILFSFYLFPAQQATFKGSDAPGAIQLQRAPTSEQWAGIIQAWATEDRSVEEAVRSYRAYLVKLDLLFPLIYGLLFAYIVIRLTGGKEQEPPDWAVALGALPLVAALVDYVENALHLALLRDVRTIEQVRNLPDLWIRVAFAASVLKWGLLLSSLLIAAAVWLWRLGATRGEGTGDAPDSSVYVPPGDLKDQENSAIMRAERKYLAERRLRTELEFLAAETGKDTGELLEELSDGDSGLGAVWPNDLSCRLVQKRLELATEFLQRELEALENEPERARLERKLKSVEGKLDDVRALSEAIQERSERDIAKLKEKVYFPGQEPDSRPIGLAFSGGGIRAAAFNLGIVQGLAKLGVLPWVDYASSVSGGGFTAACLTSLLSWKKDVTAQFHFNTHWPRFPFNPDIETIGAGGTRAGKTPPKNDAAFVSHDRGINRQLRHLREKGNWLIPRMGGISRDLLQLLGALLGGIGYTVIVFMLALLAFSATHYALTASLSPSILGAGGIPRAAAPALAGTDTDGEPLELTAASTAEAPASPPLVAILFRDRPPPASEIEVEVAAESPLPLAEYGWAIGSGVGLSVVVIFLAFLLYAYGSQLPQWLHRWFESGSDVRHGLPSQELMDKRLLFRVAVVSLTIMGVVLAVIKGWSHRGDTGDQVFWIWLPALFFLGSWFGLGLIRLLFFAPERLPSPWRRQDSVWSSPRFRTVFWAIQGITIYGLAASLVFTLMALPLFFAATDGPGTGKSLVSTAVSAVGAALLTYVNSREKSDAGGAVRALLKLPGRLRNIALGALVIVFNLSIIYLFETAIDRKAEGLLSRVVANGADPVLSPVHPAFLAAVALALLLLMMRFVNLNYISLHYFWRDRMGDAYLKTEVTTEDGAVAMARDFSDQELVDVNAAGCSSPYHLAVATINVPGTWHLKYKDRKSAHFVFSRDYCGSEITGYAKTDVYRNGRTGYAKAVALSGAYASPSLGLRTFFAQAYMLTLLNVRMGLWLLNPALYKPGRFGKQQSENLLTQFEEQRTWLSSWWFKYLWHELRGTISERHELVHLTDGGHTGDNGGLFPLFQRGCKVIIVGDASCDQDYTCDDLFRVIQQAELELGVQVEIDVQSLKPASEKEKDGRLEGQARFHYAIGQITYPNGQYGILLYLKPAITRRDASEILHYWETHRDKFPQTPSADQFFEEQQFEAYRHLGQFTVEDTYRELLRTSYRSNPGKLAGYYPYFYRKWEIDRRVAKRTEGLERTGKQLAEIGKRVEIEDMSEQAIGFWKLGKYPFAKDVVESLSARLRPAEEEPREDKAKEEIPPESWREYEEEVAPEPQEDWGGREDYTHPMWEQKAQ